MRLSVCLIAATAALSASPALAYQTKPVQDFNGVYDLACSDSALVLTISLTGVIGTAAGSWYDTAEAPIGCVGVDAQELQTFIDDLATGCSAGGLPYADCYDVAAEIGQAVADLNNDLLSLLPESVTMTVLQTNNWWNQLIGIFPMRGAHVTMDGAVHTWDYLVNNNYGYANGDFDALGLAFGESSTSGSLSCGVISAAAVSGRISRANNFAMDADFLIDQSLLCSVVEGDDWLLGTISLSYVGTMVGGPAE